MNKKRVFFAGLISCLIVNNFSAAEKRNNDLKDTVKHLIPIFPATKMTASESPEIELTTIKSTPFIPLTEGLKTLVPKILVTWKRDGGIKIDEILPFDEQWTLKGLIKYNFCYHSTQSPVKNLFLPLIIKVKDDGSMIKMHAFDSEYGSPNTTEACRQKKAVFYPYKQGAIISFLEAKKIDIELLKQNENSLKKWIDKAVEEELRLDLPEIYVMR